MDVTPILDPLNDAQRAAVTSGNAPALVIAGAGSGKTRVLVHRIAWLCEVESVSPFSMLAVTFTNKAAAEMRARVESLLNYAVGGMWMGTFHGISHRLLRVHWQEAGLKENFQVLDSDDQLRLVKRIIQDLGLDDSRWPPKQARGYINSQKEEGLRSGHLQDHGDRTAQQLIRIYAAYEQECARTGSVDFAELLLRSLELLQQKAEILAHYREKFRHILVDEFQDTNAIQYKWLKTFAGEKNPVFAVGDDDQSIYGWRGARIENIHSFERDYRNTQVFRLEQNYRSTDTILSVANSLIDNNRGRMGKKLWTDGGAGEPVHLYAAFNEQDEARFVADRIKQWAETGTARRDEVAVLYRSNAQSRVFEEVFISQSIPYRVYGGCVSLNGQKSGMRWPTCVWREIRMMTRPSSALSTYPRAGSGSARWPWCVILQSSIRPHSGRPLKKYGNRTCWPPVPEMHCTIFSSSCKSWSTISGTWSWTGRLTASFRCPACWSTTAVKTARRRSHGLRT